MGTLQTLTKCHKKFTPGFFDLVIFDECHRSIYNQFREVVEYFDGRIIGLTATPADFIDRNTFQVFHCFDNIPTFNYPYRDAVAEGYLVDYSLYQAQTHFQREGIRGANLSEVERLKLEVVTGDVNSGTLESIADDVSYLPDFVYQDSQRRGSMDLCLSSKLRTATPEQLNRIIADLASQMKNRRSRPSSFVEIDLRDRIAVSGYITLGEGGEQIYIEEYRQRVEGKVSEIVETHPTIAAIRNGEAVTDLQLVALERTLRQELGRGNVQLSESNIRKAFNLKVESLLAFLRELLEIEGLPDYQEIVRRNFEEFIAQRQFNANQIRFLRAVENVFLKKRRLEVADLYEEPLDRFGEDAVERWFSEEQVEELIGFTEQLAA